MPLSVTTPSVVKTGSENVMQAIVRHGEQYFGVHLDRYSVEIDADSRFARVQLDGWIDLDADVVNIQFADVPKIPDPQKQIPAAAKLLPGKDGG